LTYYKQQATNNISNKSWFNDSSARFLAIPCQVRESSTLSRTDASGREETNGALLFRER